MNILEVGWDYDCQPRDNVFCVSDVLLCKQQAVNIVRWFLVTAQLLLLSFFFLCRMRVMDHNWSARNQRLHLYSVAGISRHAFSFVRGQDLSSSGSRLLGGHDSCGSVCLWVRHAKWSDLLQVWRKCFLTWRSLCLSPLRFGDWKVKDQDGKMSVISAVTDPRRSVQLDRSYSPAMCSSCSPAKCSSYSPAMCSSCFCSNNLRLEVRCFLEQ